MLYSEALGLSRKPAPHDGPVNPLNSSARSLLNRRLNIATRKRLIALSEKNAVVDADPNISDFTPAIQYLPHRTQ